MRARSMLFTLYGDSIQRYGGEIAARSLAAIMGTFGFSPPSVRGALVRMVRQGWLIRRRLGRLSYYALTLRGRLRVEHGTRRIYTLDHRPWDGIWRIFTYAVPESRRSTRDRLRRELAWLGMGALAPSTWITPYDLREHLAAFIEAHDLRAYVAEFAGTHTGPSSDRSLVARCWDLAAVTAWHEGFERAFQPGLEAARRRAAAGVMPKPREAFVEKVRLVHEYRKALYVDPWLPGDLLPADWRGQASARMFFEYYQLLDPAATRAFEEMFEAPPDAPRVSPGTPFRNAVA